MATHRPVQENHSQAGGVPPATRPMYRGASIPQPTPGQGTPHPGRPENPQYGNQGHKSSRRFPNSNYRTDHIHPGSSSTTRTNAKRGGILTTQHTPVRNGAGNYRKRPRSDVSNWRAQSNAAQNSHTPHKNHAQQIQKVAEANGDGKLHSTPKKVRFEHKDLVINVSDVSDHPDQQAGRPPIDAQGYEDADKSDQSPAAGKPDTLPGGQTSQSKPMEEPQEVTSCAEDSVESQQSFLAHGRASEKTDLQTPALTEQL